MSLDRCPNQPLADGGSGYHVWPENGWRWDAAFARYYRPCGACGFLEYNNDPTADSGARAGSPPIIASPREQAESANRMASVAWQSYYDATTPWQGGPDGAGWTGDDVPLPSQWPPPDLKRRVYEWKLDPRSFVESHSWPTS